MSKRFTDTEKWKRPWFRKLPNEYKLLWSYICDTCDIAGVWYVDLELASFLIGSPLDLETARAHFAKQIIEIEEGTRWFICDFTAFQYGELTPTNNLHRSVLASLNRYGVSPKPGAQEGQNSPSRGAKDKDTVKDKEKEGGAGEARPYPLPDPVREPAKCLVITFKTLLGVPFDDREWDRNQFSRNMAAASSLLHHCRDLATAERCLKDLGTTLDGAGKTWTFETVVRLAPDWLKKNGRNDASASRHSLRMAIAQRRTEDRGPGGLEKVSAGSLPAAFRDRPHPADGNKADVPGTPGTGDAGDVG